MTSYSEPEQVLEEGKRYALDLDTSHGPISAVLDPDLGGPIPNSIAFLATRASTTASRSIASCPASCCRAAARTAPAPAGPGYEVVGTPPRFYEYKVGDVAMAKTAVAPAGASGSQFFVISGKSGEGLPAGVRDPGPRSRRRVPRHDRGASTRSAAATGRPASRWASIP